MSLGVHGPKTLWKQAGRSARRVEKRVTMTDVARLAECSQATVSVVLNSVPGIHISEATRQRVLSAVRTLGYRHRPQTRGATAAAGQLALLVDRFATRPDSADAIDAASDTAWRGRRTLSVFRTSADPQYERRILDSIVRAGVDGIIYAADSTREVTPPLELYSVAVPVVLLNCFARDNVFPSVVPADAAAGRRGTRALIEAGHTRVAHIAGELWMDPAADRQQGYRQALETAGLPFRPEYVREASWQAEIAYQRTHQLMDLGEPPTAIFCASDRMAASCYEALKERGLSIPGDVSVVGFDDAPPARHLDPPLTTLALPRRAMGRWAVERVLAAAEPGAVRASAGVTRLECEMVERDSIAPPPGGTPR